MIRSESGERDGRALHVNDTVFLQNAYMNLNGGYLDTRGAGCENNYLCVSTSQSQDRDNGSTWWTFRQ